MLKVQQGILPFNYLVQTGLHEVNVFLADILTRWKIFYNSPFKGTYPTHGT